MAPGRDSSYSAICYTPEVIIASDAGMGQFDGDTTPSTWVPRMIQVVNSVMRKVQDATKQRLYMLNQNGDIDGFLYVGLGQQDSAVPLKPGNWVGRTSVVNYPTDFSSMADADISQLSNRGDQLAQALDTLGVETLTHIYMIDVGQGDCFALVDQNEKICLYVDYGGLADHPDKDNPGNTRRRMPDVHPNGQVPVLLTHWDKDHYWSAKKKNPHAKRSEWIVPRQKASPQAVRFSTEVDNMRCWPESLGSTLAFVKLGQRQLQVRKCGAYRPSRISGPGV